MSDVVKKVQELLKLPQDLCNMCGKCCRVAVFKGGLSHDAVVELAKSTEGEASQIEGANDFLSIFVPYESLEAARVDHSQFIDETAAYLNKKPEDVGFYHCRYINEKNMCMIHEDRPLLCRMYPIPHERTLYQPGCGFAQQGKKNWDQIKQIIADLENKRDNI